MSTSLSNILLTIQQQTTRYIYSICSGNNFNLMAPIHTLIFYELKDGECGILYNSVAALYHSIFTTVAGFVLLALIMSSCAILIYRNLVLKRQRCQIHIRQQTEYTYKIRDQQALAILFVQILFYVILIIPLMAFYSFTTF